MICIIDCGTEWLEEIKGNLDKSGHSYKVIRINELVGCKFDSFSGIIVSGAPILLTRVDLKKYVELFRFIKTIDIPVLGICFGHQIIGLLYGSEINIGKKIDKKERIEIMEQDVLFANIENNAFFREEHSEFITLPQEFNLLARSDSCDNEAMKHKHKKLYSTQFHPEVSSDNGGKLLKNFLFTCSKK